MGEGRATRRMTQDRCVVNDGGLVLGSSQRPSFAAASCSQSLQPEDAPCVEVRGAGEVVLGQAFDGRHRLKHLPHRPRLIAAFHPLVCKGTRQATMEAGYQERVTQNSVKVSELKKYFGYE